MTKQRIVGILTLLSLVIGADITFLKGGAVDYASVIPGLLAGIGLIAHPPVDAPVAK